MQNQAKMSNGEEAIACKDFNWKYSFFTFKFPSLV